jgi:pyruvate dehydrogenase E2 component (dihydrolipoamide acetyltransferase)
MAQEVLMPKLGLTMTEGTIEEWKYKEGDSVKKGDILFSVATDKLTNDVEAEADGVLLKILLPEGETAPCKAVIAYIGEAGEVIAEGGASAESTAAQAPASSAAAVPAKAPAATRDPGTPVLASPAAKKLAKEKGVDLALVAGTGPKGRITLEDVEAYLTAPKADEPAAEVKTSPLAAKIAEELGVDVSKIQTDGRVMKADVLAAAGVCTAAPAAEAAPAISASDNDEPPVKVNPLRRSIAANMANSWHTSPRVTYTFAVDVTAMKALRAKLKDSLKEQGIKLTYNHILMKVVAKALMEFPDVNASFADNMLTRHKHVNMGLAVAKGDGLIVPNVKNADSKSLAEIAKETEALIEATRSGKIDMKDMTGGTFTISSLGPYGVRSFSPIINQPELAILGVCDIVDTPIVCNGEIVIRPMMNLCLTADHRVVDGVMASKFMKRVVELLENLYLLLI